jgi:hypothetical protein
MMQATDWQQHSQASWWPGVGNRDFPAGRLEAPAGDRRRALSRHASLTVADKDGDRKITIGPDTAIWIARAARITDIKVGSAVTMTGVRREDGSLQVTSR